eukprot:TRINITY_DN4559_c0_g1_i7.p3 TRINITY_DN4559_c0_g1~~TRINITY_DN4559_c0_g1_i7.p3  ORF type:complete len:114 (+),score=31.02 TRINITY_DN4559_c0_g1_i7:354-695(+)
MYISQPFVTPAILGYNYGAARTVTSYTITYSNGNIKTRSPKDFDLEGLAADGTWKTVDRRREQTISVWAAAGNKLSYTVDAPGAHTSYRIVVQDDNDARPRVVALSIGELVFS